MTASFSHINATPYLARFPFPSPGSCNIAQTETSPIIVNMPVKLV